MRLPRQPMKTIPNEIKKRNMTREAFIRKWLANPQKQYNEQCRDEMRDDLDLVIEAALRQPPVSGSVADAVGRNCPFCGEPCPECSHKATNR